MEFEAWLVYGTSIFFLLFFLFLGSIFWALGIYQRVFYKKGSDRPTGDVLYAWEIKESTMRLSALRNIATGFGSFFFLFVIFFSLTGSYSLVDILYRALILASAWTFFIGGIHFWELAGPEIRRYVITTAGISADGRLYPWAEFTDFFNAQEALGKTKKDLGKAINWLGVPFEDTEDYDSLHCSFRKRKRENLFMSGLLLLCSEGEMARIEESLSKYLPQKHFQP